MQTERTFIDELKHQFRYGSMTIRLIFINVIVFLAIRIISVFADLSSSTGGLFISELIDSIFGLQTDFISFITHPWGLLTSMFTHYGFMHIAFNMLFLYFSGKLFEQLFDQKRLLYTYLLGGIFGGILEIIAHAIFPKLQMTSDLVIGASGSIMAIFVAIAFYRPNLKVNLFGLLPVRIIILALIFILYDLLGLGSTDGTAHFAHIGGAILGIISIQNLNSSSNIVLKAIAYGTWFLNWLKRIFSKSSKPKFKVHKGGNKGRPISDEEYASQAKDKQDQIDKILDKISKSGYESLTKKEKEFLFNQSRK